MTAYSLADRLDYVGRRMQELNQNTLTLIRVDESNVAVDNFTPEKITVEALALYGIVLVNQKAQAFVFDTSKYSSWTDNFPKVGDRISWEDRIYEVMVMGDEVYTFTTSSRLRVRVNTKQVG